MSINKKSKLSKKKSEVEEPLDKYLNEEFLIKKYSDKPELLQALKQRRNRILEYKQ